MSSTLNRITTGRDIEIIVKDNGRYVLGSVQNYSIRCELNYQRINAAGESQPTDYYVNGRTYTITLSRVALRGTKLRKMDGKSVYASHEMAWQDFELVIKFNGTDGSKNNTRVFRNCYRIEAGESGDYDSPVIDNITIVSHNCNYDTFDDGCTDDKYYRRKKLKYGDFKFPYNPHTIEWSSDRKYVEHKFPGLKKNDIEDFGVNCAVVHCEGFFYSKRDDNGHADETALQQWNKLRKEYRTGLGPKSTYIPVLRNGITKSLMINLKGKMENQSGLVEYSFDLIEYNPPSVAATAKKSTVSSPKKPSGSSSSSSSKKSGKISSTKDIKVGDLVYITGVCRYDSYGSKPYSKSYSGYKTTITKIMSNPKKGQDYPICVGCIGWVSLSQLTWSK